jgi:hypothetical protein
LQIMSVSLSLITSPSSMDDSKLMIAEPGIARSVYIPNSHPFLLLPHSLLSSVKPEFQSHHKALPQHPPVAGTLSLLCLLPKRPPSLNVLLTLGKFPFGACQVATTLAVTGTATGTGTAAGKGTAGGATGTCLLTGPTTLAFPFRLFSSSSSSAADSSAGEFEDSTGRFFFFFSSSSSSSLPPREPEP